MFSSRSSKESARWTGDNNSLEKFYLDGIPPAPHGLALGYLSIIIPVVSLGITILVAHYLCGIFGVALGSLGYAWHTDNGD